MKKKSTITLTLAFALTLTLTLAACGGNDAPADSSVPNPPSDTLASESTPTPVPTPSPTPVATTDDNGNGNNGDGNDAVLPGYTTLSGNAFVGGTFLTDGGVFDWIDFDDQAVAFELGVPFTVRIDMGSGTQTLGHSDNLGILMMSLQTDFAYYSDTLEYYIDEVLVDGVSVELNPSKANAEMSPVRDEQEPFVWDENGNAVEKFQPIGIFLSGSEGVFGDTPIRSRDLKDREFSKMEITLAIVEEGTPNPFN